MECEDMYVDQQEIEEDVVDCIDEMDPEKGLEFEEGMNFICTL